MAVTALVVGVLAYLGIERALSALIYGVNGCDPLMIVLATLVLGAAGG